MEHAFTHRPPPKKKKKSPHSSLHLLQLDKISCLCSAVALIGQGGENRLLTQTQAAHSLTSVLVSLWTLMRKGLGFNSAELNWLCYECFVFSADRSLKICLPFFIAFKPQFYLLLHWWMFTLCIQYLPAESTFLKKTVFILSSCV